MWQRTTLMSPDKVRSIITELCPWSMFLFVNENSRANCVRVPVRGCSFRFHHASSLLVAVYASTIKKNIEVQLLLPLITGRHCLHWSSETNEMAGVRLSKQLSRQTTTNTGNFRYVRWCYRILLTLIVLIILMRNISVSFGGYIWQMISFTI